MKQYKVYLFDFDGTLFDTLPSSVYVFKEAFSKKGIELNEEDILHYTRVPIPETYRKIVPSCKEEDIEPFLDMITELVNSNRKYIQSLILELSNLQMRFEQYDDNEDYYDEKLKSQSDIIEKYICEQKELYRQYFKKLQEEKHF